MRSSRSPSLLATLALLAGTATAQDVQNVVLLDGGVGDAGSAVIQTNSRRVVFTDFDGDGDTDLYVLNWGTPSQFFVNDGTGQYTLDLDANNNNPIDNAIRYGKGAPWFDWDNDGDMDYALLTGPNALGQQQRNLIVRNDTTTQDDPIFKGVQVLSQARHSYDGAFFDADGGARAPGGTDVVLVVANRRIDGVADSGRNRLYRHQGGGVFVEDPTTQITTEVPVSSRAVEAADFDGDGLIDVVIGNADQSNPAMRAYRNNGAGGFPRDLTTGFPQLPNHVYGLAVGDLDNDGDLDLVSARRESALVGATNAVWHNVSTAGDINFTLVSGTAFSAPVEVSYDVAVGDLDLDGDLDLVVANNLGTNRVYMNNRVDAAFADGALLDAPASAFTAVTHGAIQADRGRTRSISLADVQDYSGDPNHQGLEVALANALTGGGEANLFYRGFGRMFVDLGAGSTVSATQPRLSGDGFIGENTDAALFMQFAGPAKTTALFGVLTATAVPFNGGTNFVSGGVALSFGVTDGLGQFDIDVPAGTVPAALEGQVVIFQAFADDDTTGAGGAMSNGLSVMLQN